MGKAISGIVQRSKRKEVPLIVVSGALTDGYEPLLSEGVTAFFSTYRNRKV